MCENGKTGTTKIGKKEKEKEKEGEEGVGMGEEGYEIKRKKKRRKERQTYSALKGIGTSVEDLSVHGADSLDGVVTVSILDETDSTALTGLGGEELHRDNGSVHGELLGDIILGKVLGDSLNVDADLNNLLLGLLSAGNADSDLVTVDVGTVQSLDSHTGLLNSGEDDKSESKSFSGLVVCHDLDTVHGTIG